jgi:N-acetylglucosaminyldiphosphoundecaprenol N-acetyl-beta-D-mannosaminyltransferase
MNETIELFGVSMHPWTMDETIQEIAARLSRGEFTQHVVVNVAKLVWLQRDEELAEAVRSCHIVNIDGAGIVFAGRLLGEEIPERVAGIDLFLRLLAFAAENSKRVFFLGGTRESLARAVENVQGQFPQLRIAGSHHGYFWEDEERVVELIGRSGADLLFVGISSPLKERFINRWKGRLGVGFAMGVGGSFDILSGKVKRAPLWMQEFGMEWLFRVLQEPRRMFRRYLVTNSVFLGMVVKKKLSQLTHST